MILSEFIVLIRDFLFSMLSMSSTYIGAFFSMYIFSDISVGQHVIVLGVVTFLISLVLNLFKGDDD